MTKKKKRKIPLPPYTLTLAYPREGKTPLRKRVSVDPPDPRDGLPNYYIDPRDAVAAFKHFKDNYFMKVEDSTIELPTIRAEDDAMATENYGVAGLGGHLLVVHETNIEKVSKVLSDFNLYGPDRGGEEIFHLTNWYEPNAKVVR